MKPSTIHVKVNDINESTDFDFKFVAVAKSNGWVIDQKFKGQDQIHFSQQGLKIKEVNHFIEGLRKGLNL